MADTDGGMWTGQDHARRLRPSVGRLSMLTMVWMRDSPAVGCIRANSARNNVLLGLAVLASFLTFNVVHTVAQTGGQGAITGTVQDSTGAVVPNATVIAHNNETGID